LLGHRKKPHWIIFTEISFISEWKSLQIRERLNIFRLHPSFIHLLTIRSDSLINIGNCFLQLSQLNTFDLFSRISFFFCPDHNLRPPLFLFCFYFKVQNFKAAIVLSIAGSKKMSTGLMKNPKNLSFSIAPVFQSMYTEI